jgi:MFS family permease
LALILTGLVFDSIIRLVLTFNSNYFRLLGIPEGFFGLLGAGFAVMGLISAPIAKMLSEKQGKVANFSMLAFITLAGLIGMAVIRSPWAALVMIPIGFSMQASGFFLSRYLNDAVDPANRATVLSFRGLAYNIGYGTLGFLYAMLGTFYTTTVSPTPTPEGVLDLTLKWFPVWFVGTALILILFLKGRRERH